MTSPGPDADLEVDLPLAQISVQDVTLMARALEQLNREGPKPWKQVKGQGSMVDWVAFASQIAERMDKLREEDKWPASSPSGESVSTSD